MKANIYLAFILNIPMFFVASAFTGFKFITSSKLESRFLIQSTICFFFWGIDVSPALNLVVNTTLTKITCIGVDKNLINKLLFRLFLEFADE
jgi:hypothetical protein